MKRFSSVVAGLGVIALVFASAPAQARKKANGCCEQERRELADLDEEIFDRREEVRSLQREKSRLQSGEFLTDEAPYYETGCTQCDPTEKGECRAEVYTSLGIAPSDPAAPATPQASGCYRIFRAAASLSDLPAACSAQVRACGAVRVELRLKQLGELLRGVQQDQRELSQDRRQKHLDVAACIAANAAACVGVSAPPAGNEEGAEADDVRGQVKQQLIEAGAAAGGTTPDGQTKVGD